MYEYLYNHPKKVTLTQNCWSEQILGWFVVTPEINDEFRDFWWILGLEIKHSLVTRNHRQIGFTLRNKDTHEMEFTEIKKKVVWITKFGMHTP